MSDTIKLSENNFKLVPAGENILLKIEKVEAKPKKNPTVVNITYGHESGAKLINKYDLNKDGALVAFSILVRLVFGSGKNEFSVSEDSDKLIGKLIECEVVHTESSGHTYANIKKTKSLVEADAANEDDEDDDL